MTQKAVCKTAIHESAVPKAAALVAMSGGVDSSVAASLILNNPAVRSQPGSCTGFTLRLYDDEGTNGAADNARAAAEKLDITHRELDFRDIFKNEVILPFIETYEAGATPNPCINCNRNIKFAFSLFRENGLNFDIFATGHYAQTEKSGSRWLLKKAADPKKDQSYVLYSLTQEQLSLCSFPLGSLTKDEVREIARERGLLNTNSGESQDICFVPDNDYAAFMERYTGKLYPPGDILDTNGCLLGRHCGHIRYTLGQRRGLGIALNEPVYVCAKNAAANTVTLGPESALYSKALIADNINLIACEKLDKPVKLTVKTRYHQADHPALVEQTGLYEMHIIFEENQRALTPGQSAVLYDGDIVVGGGVIKQVI